MRLSCNVARMIRVNTERLDRMQYALEQSSIKVRQGDVVRKRGDEQAPTMGVVSFDPAWQTVRVRVGLTVDVLLIEDVELLYPAKN